MVSVSAFKTSGRTNDPLAFFQQPSVTYRGCISANDTAIDNDKPDVFTIEVEAAPSMSFLGSPVARHLDNGAFEIFAIVASCEYSSNNNWRLQAVSIPETWQDAYGVANRLKKSD